VQAGGARHLRQALHRALDVLAGDHHQVAISSTMMTMNGSGSRSSSSFVDRLARSLS
jgi:hypothetical protein